MTPINNYIFSEECRVELTRAEEIRRDGWRDHESSERVVGR